VTALWAMLGAMVQGVDVSLRRNICRNTSEVQHHDVFNIQIDQSLFERLLRIGEIGISSSGQDDLGIVASRFPSPESIDG
jgi:uncharacterized membrane protein YdbT with pleckstrin-like domain